jgi:hypothetical protein
MTPMTAEPRRTEKSSMSGPAPPHAYAPGEGW